MTQVFSAGLRAGVAWLYTFPSAPTRLMQSLPSPSEVSGLTVRSHQQAFLPLYVRTIRLLLVQGLTLSSRYSWYSFPSLL